MADDDGQLPAAVVAPSVQGGFKQRKNRGNMRKRPTEDEQDAAEEETAVVRKQKQQRGDPLAFTTKQEGKRDDVAVTFASIAGSLAAKDTTATRELETETAYDRDARCGGNPYSMLPACMQAWQPILAWQPHSPCIPPASHPCMINDVASHARYCEFVPGLADTCREGGTEVGHQAF
jgi:hypothetical protein